MKRLFLVLALMLVLPVVRAADPGHPASDIGSGTFESGDYAFPEDLNVSSNISSSNLNVSGTGFFGGLLYQSGLLLNNIFLQLAGGTMSGNINMAGFSIQNASSVNTTTLLVGGGFQDTDGGLTIDSQGNIFSDGSLTFSGETYTAHGQDINGSIIPFFPDVFTLGNSSNTWLSLYATNIYEGGSSLSSKYLNFSSTFSGDITGTPGNLQLTSNSVGTSEIQDGSINSEDLADQSITNPKIVPSAVNATQLSSAVAGSGLNLSEGLNVNLSEGGGLDFSGNSLSLNRSCSLEEVLKWSGSSWYCSADESSGNSGNVTGAGSGGQVAVWLSSSYIYAVPASSLDVNSSNISSYWDGYDSPAGWDTDASDDITTGNIANQNVNSSNTSLYWSGYSSPSGWDLDSSDDLTTATSWSGDFTGTGSSPAIAPASVTNTKIGASAVNDTQLADAAVTNTKVAVNTINDSQLQSGAVTNTKIATGAINDTQLAANIVTSTKIADAAVTNTKVAVNTINDTQLADAAVTNAKIGAGAVNDTQLASNAVTEAKIADGAVTANKITIGAINNTQLNSNVASSGLNYTSGAGLQVNLTIGGGIVFNANALSLNSSCSLGQILKMSAASMWYCAGDDNTIQDPSPWSNNTGYIYPAAGYPDKVNVTGNFSVGGSTFFVDVNQNMVGIGTMNPLVKLHVVGQINATDSVNTPIVRINGASGLAYSGSELQIGESSTWQTLSFWTGDIARMIIASDGKIGINNTSPQSALQIGNESDSSPDYLQIDTNDGAPPAEDCDSDLERGRMVLDYIGNNTYICNGAIRGWDYIALSD